MTIVVTPAGTKIGIYTWSGNPYTLTNNWVSSNKFTIKTFPDNEFTLQIRTVSPQYSFGCSLNLALTKTNERVITADITIDFLANTHTTSTVTKKFSAWTDRIDFGNMATSSSYDLTGIKCTISLHDPVEIFTIEKPPSSNLHHDMEHFFLESSLSDCNLIIGKDELPAHKLILSAHSPVFLSMFTTEMREKKENLVVIKDVTIEVMKNVLAFLYTGCDKALEDPAMALSILAVAERYTMKKLKSLCEYKLAKNLTVTNAIEIVDNADTYTAEDLLAVCINFLVRNKKEIVNTEDFAALGIRKPELMILYIRKLAEI